MGTEGEVAKTVLSGFFCTGTFSVAFIGFRKKEGST